MFCDADFSMPVEEIDRFALDFDGRSAPLVRRASFEFFRAAPPGGWTRGHPGTATPAEVEGEDFQRGHGSTGISQVEQAVAVELKQRVRAFGRELI